MSSGGLSKTKWPADEIRRWPIEKLIPSATNARTHSESQVAQIAASIREWGWTVPVLIDEIGTIIAGHGRVLAARQLGVQTIPVLIAMGWTDAQKKAYALADNQIPLNSGWDREMLDIQLGELSDVGFDVDLLGFPDLSSNSQAGEALKLADGFEYRVIVDCDGEEHQESVLNQLDSLGLKCRPLIS